MARRTHNFSAGRAADKVAECESPYSAFQDSLFSFGIVLLVLALTVHRFSALALAGDYSVRPIHPDVRLSDVPFKLYQGYVIVLEGRLGPLEHQNFLVDTGSSPSMIDQGVSEKLGLKGLPEGLALFNKNLAAVGVTLPDIQFGPIHRQNLHVMVSDFSKIGAGIGTRIDAVIGLDVLGATNFTIDYEKRRLCFHATRERHSAPFSADQQFITIDLKTGDRQLHLLLDTGTPRLVLFKRALHNLDFEWTTKTGNGHNISGPVLFETIVLPKARFGTLEVGPQAASVVPNQREVETEYDGLIGISCLRPRRISFDFNRQLLGWSD